MSRMHRLGWLVVFALGTTLTMVSWAAAEQTGTPRRVLAADYSTHRLGIVAADGTLEWEYPIKDIHEAMLLPSGNLLFQTSWTRLLEVTPDKKIVWEYDAATSNGNTGRKVEVHGFQRLENGRTMIAESGPGRIIEVDAAGKLQHEVKLQIDQPDPHRDTRLVRKLKNGNYLVCHEGQGMVREYDASGKVVWQHDVKGQLYSAERLDSGNTLIGAGSLNQVLEVNPAGETVWSLNKDDLPGITLAWVTMVERLANGNTRLVNCHAGPDNPQMIEVTADKRVVWTFKDFEHFGNSMPVGRVIEQ